MILIISDENDLHSDIVAEKLVAKSVDFIRLNLNKKALLNTKITFYNSEWHIETPSCSFKSSDISCVWNRRTYVELLLEEQYDNSPDFKIWCNEWNKTLLGFYNSIDNVIWLNHHRNSQRAENKYLQMALANKIGLLMPDTLISNHKETLCSFIRKHNKVALKLMRQDIYKVDHDKYLGFYVNCVTASDLADFQDNNENPIVLQEYIEKDYEVRYTIVGDKHFVCKIDSQASERTKLDWRRYDLSNTPHEIIDAPDDIKSKIIALMNSLNIKYGALDFIVNPKGEWYFLEVNSMGQYLWIEDLTGLPISDSIVDFLLSHTKPNK